MLHTSSFSQLCILEYWKSLSTFLQIETDSTSFFPTLRACCLKDEQDTTKEEIAELKEMMLTILDKLKVGLPQPLLLCIPVPSRGCPPIDSFPRTEVR